MHTLQENPDANFDFNDIKQQYIITITEKKTDKDPDANLTYRN